MPSILDSPAPGSALGRWQKKAMAASQALPVLLVKEMQRHKKSWNSAWHGCDGKLCGSSPAIPNWTAAFASC
jgi:hypothetical protein